MYTLDLGPIEQSIAKQAIRSGSDIPERIANAPRLLEGSAFYLQAFFDLDSERMRGMSLGLIPWSAMVRYGTYYGLEHDEIEALVKHLRALDNANLNWIVEHNANG